MRSYQLGTILCAVLLAAGCASSQKPADDVETIMALEHEWSDRFQAKDVDWIAGLHVEHARQLPPGAPAVVGAEAIRAAWQTMADTDGLTLTIEPLFADVSGDRAYDVGKGILTTPDGLARPIKYVVIWERHEGQWKVVLDMFNFNE